MRRLLAGMGTALLVFVAGCEQEAVEPRPADMTRSEALALAPQFDALGAGAIDGQIGSVSFAATPSDAVASPNASETRVVEFTRTSACPKGGEVVVSGKITHQMDRATRTLTSETAATKTQSNCTFERRGGTISVSGDPNIKLTASHKRVNGMLSGPQTTTQQGAFTWSRDTGASGSCQVDLRSVLDPENRSHTLSGMFCGHEISRTVTRQ